MAEPFVPVHWCDERLQLELIGLDTAAELRANWVGCMLKAEHSGAHQGVRGSQEKFGYVVRFQWIDAFPDMPGPEGE